METVRGFADLAALRSISGGNDVQLPDPLAVNMAKYHFAHGFHAATTTLIDLAGGPSRRVPAATTDPQTRRVLAKYFATAAARRRTTATHPPDRRHLHRPVGRLPVGPGDTRRRITRGRKLQISRAFDPRGPAVALGPPRRPQRLTNATRSGSNRRAVPTEPRRLPTGGWSGRSRCRARRTGPDRAYFTIKFSINARLPGWVMLHFCAGPDAGRRQLLLRVLR